MLSGVVGSVFTPAWVTEDVKAAPLQQAATNIVISEFRTVGPLGGNDEFIELYNPTSSSIDISGWQVWGSNSSSSTSNRKTIPSSATSNIPPGGHYLITHTGSTYVASADTTYVSGITNDGGIAIFASTDLINPVDQVGMSAGAAYKEGTVLTPLSVSTNQSYERDAGGLLDSCDDTGNNLADFQLINPSNPQSSTSPRRLCGVASDLIITMDSNGSTSITPTVGTTITFTINITNSGPNDATNVTVKDDLPTGLTYVSDTGTGAFNSGTGIWTIASLPSGSSATLEITATVASGGTKINQAEVWSADQIDSDSIAGNNSTTEDDNASVTITPPTFGSADLSLTKTVNNSSPVVGDNIVFTLTVNNAAGPDNAEGIQVKDLIPDLLSAGLVYVSDDGSGVYNSVTGIWNVGTLAVGASEILKITAKVTTIDPKINTATITQSYQADTNSSNNSASVTVTPSGGVADLSLTMDMNKAVPGVAGTVVFTITVTNTDPLYDATNVEVKDLLPTGLTYVSDSGSGTYNKTTGIWSVGTLAKNSSKVLNITAKVDSSGTRTNLAEIWDADQTDPDSTAGNSSTTEDDDDSEDVQVADLSLTKTMSNVNPSVGQSVVFEITVSNSSAYDDATNVQVKDLLPSSFTYVSDNSLSIGTSYNPSPASGIWNVGTLASGTSKTLTITTTVNSSTLIINQAEVSQSDQIDLDSVPNNDSRVEDDDASAPSADLSLTHSVNNENPDINDNVVFTITVTNNGIGGTTNVQVKDLLPSGLTYVSDTGSGAYNKTTGIWTVGTLSNGTSEVLSITAKVTTSGIKTNSAEVWKSDESDPDSVPGNGSTTEDDDASATVTSYRSIIINEVAWAGTGSSASLLSDQWIELYNPGTTSINITGWTLKSTSGSINITLSGTIKAGEYFLLERDDNSTVSDITADQIYTGALSVSGEVLTLRDGLTNFIDTANGNGGSWPKGNSSTYGTMERLGTSAESDSTWATNTGVKKNGKNANSEAILGTPRGVNSTGATPTATPVPINPTSSTLVGRPIINEYLARPGYDWNQDGVVDVFDEFIEIKNIGPVDINLNGWKLDDEDGLGSAPFTISDVTLKPGERAVFYGLETNILLSDGGDTVRLMNASNKVYDAHTYAIAKVEDESWCRLPDGNGSWFEDCTPTPNLTNTREGQAPTMPSGDDFESPVCSLPDTLPEDFLLAECRGYGANIWRSMYWDETGWQGDQFVPSNRSKQASFVE